MRARTLRSDRQALHALASALQVAIAVPHANLRELADLVLTLRSPETYVGRVVAKEILLTIASRADVSHLALLKFAIRNVRDQDPIHGFAECCVESARQRGSADVEPHPCVVAARRLMESEYHVSSLRVAHVARSVGVSVYHLSRVFHKETGVTLAQYLGKVRTEKAVALLRNSGMSVKEVSAAVGYARPTVLDRQFRSRYGRTPSDYRRTQPND